MSPTCTTGSSAEAAVPVALGTGDRMFGEMDEKKTFKVMELKPIGDDGVLVLTYQRR